MASPKSAENRRRGRQTSERGQVGTIVEKLDESTVLVEFSDDEGQAYVLAACPRDALSPLRTMPIAA